VLSRRRRCTRRLLRNPVSVTFIGGVLRDHVAWLRSLCLSPGRFEGPFILPNTARQNERLSVCWIACPRREPRQAPEIVGIGRARRVAVSDASKHDVWLKVALDTEDRELAVLTLP
jgi:hypothetical protein